MPDNQSSNVEDGQKWRQLVLLALAVWLGMTLWFSATSVSRPLETSWGLGEGQIAWLTNGVQLGFVAGTLVSAVLNLADRIPVHRLFTLSALLGAAANASIALMVSDDVGRSPRGFTLVVALRLLTGVSLAGVYPTGMKMMATWFQKGRGLAIGVLVAALTVGSGTPYLLRLLPLDQWGTDSWPAWRIIMATVSLMALAAAAVGWLWLRPGPHLAKAKAFQWSYFLKIWADTPLRRANFGYLGHMIELYAMWTWVPRLIASSFERANYPQHLQIWAAFGIFAMGSLGCVIAGLVADRFGRTRVTIASLITSGCCALVAGFLGDHPILLTVICLLWGFAVVADSAQFSAAISELCQPQLVGTALTIQTCGGFLLTTISITLVAQLQAQLGPGYAFAILAIGPAFGIYHMARLRSMPEAVKMASGNR